jgi:molecular chaperone DnaJ
VKRCYYDILEIERNATDDAIKAAYRKKALEYHPDRNPSTDAEELFKAASEAYEVLSDRQKRQIYDRFGHEGLDQRGLHHGYADVADIFSHFTDIFDDFFGFGGIRGRSGPRGGRDLRYDLSINFRESYEGTEKKIQLRGYESCGDCGGRGHPADAPPQTCPHCRGSGQLVHSQGFIAFSRTCEACGGRGQILTKICKLCQGEGRVELAKSLKVKIPPGIDQGMQLCLRGEGEAGEAGRRAGDLYVVVHIQPDGQFHREGDHLVIRQKVNVVQAALGLKISVPTMDGKEELKLPEGVQSGEVLKVKGKGMPRLQKGGKGDLLVQILVETPRKLNKRQKKILEDLGESFGGLEDKD